MRSALITGVSGSIGSAIAAQLIADGFEVTGVSRHRVAGDGSRTQGMKIVCLDLRKPDEIATLGAEYDCLINCAGINIASTVTGDVSVQDWAETLAVNLTAPFLLTRVVLPHMRNHSWGRIVNVGSIYSVRGSALNAPYNSSKHGLSGLTKSVAREYAQYGITCNEVLPGAVESDLMSSIAQRKALEIGVSAADYLQSIADASPRHRLVAPIEVAATCGFLCSDAANGVNGASLVVDGGTIC